MLINRDLISLVNMHLSEDKKLTILYRVEPGCLGPDGVEHVEGLCKFAQMQLHELGAGFVIWNIIPRFDKSLPETEYFIKNKNLPRDKAKRYVEVFAQNLNQLEENLAEQLMMIIEQYLEATQF